MEPINGLERLTGLLRKKTAENSSSARLSKRDVGTPAKSQGRLSVTLLEQQMQQKIKKLQQVQAPPSALQRAVIESILVWEFGEHVRNEPKFVALVNRVKQHVEEELDLKAAMENLYKKLTR